ncbi:hypothetical protein MUG78_13885 [Gordonia alkaliphila]|uniref:hypothetical protein n=1 Tax=Gordonia alkaliphila TaxID=1053547 RepID=UPI001FF3492E|nr:hypothetical protein [Gordonia alkaliphila]MCK0440514.1 hypothetical protein [Gordonia alkaliphila]
MDAAILTDFTDLLSDDLAVGVATGTESAGGLAHFLAHLRAVTDDRELLALAAAFLRLRNVVDHGLAAVCAGIEAVGLPARKHVRSAAAILTELDAAPAVAYRAVRLGKAMADEGAGPVTRGMRDGALSAEKADAVVTGLTHVTDRVDL